MLNVCISLIWTMYEWVVIIQTLSFNHFLKYNFFLDAKKPLIMLLFLYFSQGFLSRSIFLDFSIIHFLEKWTLFVSLNWSADKTFGKCKLPYIYKYKYQIMYTFLFFLIKSNSIKGIFCKILIIVVLSFVLVFTLERTESCFCSEY